MSIVFLLRSLGFGGAERQLVELAKGFQSRGLSVLVIVFYSGGPFLEELAEAGVRVAVLEKRGRWDLLRFLGRLARAIRREKPQVVYSFLVVPSILAVVLKVFVPRARIVWGVLASEVDLSHYDWFATLTFRLSCWLARFADLIIVNSTSGAQYHQDRGYPTARITVLPSGVDVERFRPDPEGGRRVRLAWGISDRDKVVGIVGRLDPMKDHQTLLEAASILRRGRVSPWFVCVGEGRPAYLERLRAIAASFGVSDRVLWAGTHRDMVAVYNAFDIVCSSSAFGEGWSNVLGEAMACGIPCVATDVGDAAHIIDNCGILVPPRDPQRLADGIRLSLARSDESVKRACRKRVVHQFSKGRLVEETERLLRACVDGTV